MRYKKLLDDVVYWLDQDDSLDGFRFQFLQYLVTGHVSVPTASNDRFLDFPKTSRASIASFSLNSLSIQYCIDSCPFIFDNPSLIYFLNSIGVTYRGEPLSSSFFATRKFNFRSRSFEPIYHGRSRVFSDIDKFLSDFPDFRERFIHLLSNGNFG